MEIIRFWVNILIVLGFILFFVLAYFCVLWTERNPRKKENILGGAMVSWIYSFKIFLMAVIVFSLIYIMISIF
ncbi:MAG: hypothetical protein HQ539_01190 [Parcubacteria group bacterium]|nr:hypothetical protein [Parcubacteria group bacterium]